MKFIKRSATLVVALAACLMLASCTAKPEDLGVADEKDMKISSVESLEGKSVAVQLRSEGDTIVTNGEITKYINRYENMENAAQALIDKKIAAMVVDSNYAKKLVADNESLAIVNNAVVGTTEYKFAAIRENGGEALIAELDKGIAYMIAAERINAVINAEMSGGEAVATLSEDGKQISGKVTLVTDPYFKPFIYKNGSDFDGLFAAVASDVVYNYGAELEIKSSEPGKTLEALEGAENTITVVSGDIDTEKYAVSDTFYTSNLVIVVRSDNVG